MLAATKRTAATLAILLAAAAAAPAVAQPGEVRVDTQWVLNWDKAHPGSTVHAALCVKVHDNFHFQSNKPLDDFLIPTTLDIVPPDGFTVREIVFPEAVMFEVAGDPVAVFESEFVIEVALEVGADVEPGVYVIRSALGYQACNDKVCHAPTSLQLEREIEIVPETEPIVERPLDEDPCAQASGATRARVVPVTSNTVDVDSDVMVALDDFTILGTSGGYQGADDFIAFIDGAEAGTLKPNVLEGKGPLVILVLVILGGLALNLTPCVLPLIPINLAIIGAGVKAGSRARGFALGGTYGLAMALAYGALGLIVTLTAATFGGINSTIWFNVAIAILFVVLGLAMFDIIHIDFSKFQSKLDLASTAKRGTFALAFGMGAVSALLAGACVAPVVIQVIVYAGDQYTKGSTLALALPFFLGLGMALPWPFAGAGLSCLPKPGTWMVRVKQALGVFILAFAVYYGYLGWEIYDSRRVDPKAVAGAVQEQLEGGWTASICDGLATAKAENKLVLIDMWATWCKACLAMDKRTFKNEAVVARLDDYVKIKFQAEDLKASPAKEMIERFEQFGLPAYAILRPKAGAIASGEAQARVTEIEEAPDPMVADGDCDVMAELEGFSVVGRTGGYVGREEFIDFIDTADAATMQRHLPEGNGPGWTDSICEGLATARAEKRPIFLEIWTTWSKNCLEMERTTLADEEVERRLADHVKIKYQADDLNSSPARELFERFYSGGLPTCVILWPKVDPVAVGN